MVKSALSLLKEGIGFNTCQKGIRIYILSPPLSLLLNIGGLVICRYTVKDPTQKMLTVKHPGLKKDYLLGVLAFSTSSPDLMDDTIMRNEAHVGEFDSKFYKEHLICVAKLGILVVCFWYCNCAFAHLCILLVISGCCKHEDIWSCQNQKWVQVKCRQVASDLWQMWKLIFSKTSYLEQPCSGFANRWPWLPWLALLILLQRQWEALCLHFILF